MRARIRLDFAAVMVGRLAGWLQPRPVLLIVALLIAQALAAAGWL